MSGTIDIPEIFPDPDIYPDLMTTEGYERHQADMRDLLERLSDGLVNRPVLDEVRRMGERYGHEARFEDESFEAEAEAMLRRPSAEAATELQIQLLGFAIMSPELTLFQKADLMAMTAEYLHRGENAVDGRAMVRRELHTWQRLVGQKIVEDSPGLIELNRHLVDLENLTKESLERKRRFSLGRRAIS